MTTNNYSIDYVVTDLELLACPSFKNLPVERGSPVNFAKNLNEIIKKFTKTSEEKPNNLYFTQFMLERFIKRNKDHQKA